ncbi:MAG: N-acetylmuramoyl-L-alanine amidase [Ketobacter sp.]|nr:N-acetylmuramoyl-L-alanine amidase [Ketobacter sp.]
MIHTAGFNKRRVTVGEIDHWHKLRGFLREEQWYSEFSPDLKHIGYNYFITKEGGIFSGRHEEEQGAHCRNGGMNRYAIGICMEGHGDHEVFTLAQDYSLFSICHDICTRHPDILRKGSAALLGHREARGVKKTCPGILINMEQYRTNFFKEVISKFSTNGGIPELLKIDLMDTIQHSLEIDTKIIPKTTRSL